MGQQIAQEYTAHGLGFDEKNDCVEVVLPDDIDTDAEKLADHARISLRGAEAALEWMRLRDQEETFRAAGDVLARLFAEIVPGTGKINAQIVGLRFIASTFLLNRGGETLTSLATRSGCSKQLFIPSRVFRRRPGWLSWIRTEKQSGPRGLCRGHPRVMEWIDIPRTHRSPPGSKRDYWKRTKRRTRRANLTA